MFTTARWQFPPKSKWLDTVLKMPGAYPVFGPQPETALQYLTRHKLASLRITEYQRHPNTRSDYYNAKQILPPSGPKTYIRYAELTYEKLLQMGGDYLDARTIFEVPKQVTPRPIGNEAALRGQR
jgi:hypothetical protein